MIHLKESMLTGVHAVSAQFAKFAQTHHYGGRTMLGQVRISRVVLLACAMCLSLPATTWASDCIINEKCFLTGRLELDGDPGDPFIADVFGRGFANVDIVAGELFWFESNMEGFSPQLGRVVVSLNREIPSTGDVEPCPEPAADGCYVNTNSFYFVLDIERLGRLVSKEPLMVKAVVRSFPPKATYEMAGAPVKFYRSNDPTQTTVLTVETASVAVQAETPIPTISAWGMVAITLLLLTGGKIAFRRRRPSAT